jgi:(p)ppGpp synthase/HD superfamily hydrolase
MTIEKAMIFMVKKHKGQLDDNGEDYDKHPLNVFTILGQVTQDQDILIASLLHDTLEDTSTTYEELKQEFGWKVADLVLEVTHEETKEGNIFPRLHSRDAILIKFADRLDNLSRMQSWGRERTNQYLRKSKFWKASVDDKISGSDLNDDIK